jgi:mono/diheme cytochrome c family protein
MTHSAAIRFIGSASVLAVAVVAAGQAPQGALSFTAAQATAGRDAYSRSCASCHLDSLRGSFEAPALIGDDFVNMWGGRTTRDLLTMMRTSMPPATPGSLGDDAYLGIIAYILSSNGAAPGPRALVD